MGGGQLTPAEQTSEDVRERRPLERPSGRSNRMCSPVWPAAGWARRPGPLPGSQGRSYSSPSNLSCLVSCCFRTQTPYPTVRAPSCPPATALLPDSWPQLRNFLLLQWPIVTALPEPALARPSRPRPVSFLPNLPGVTTGPSQVFCSAGERCHTPRSELHLVFCPG